MVGADKARAQFLQARHTMAGGRGGLCRGLHGAERIGFGGVGPCRGGGGGKELTPAAATWHPRQPCRWDATPALSCALRTSASKRGPSQRPFCRWACVGPARLGWQLSGGVAGVQAAQPVSLAATAAKCPTGPQQQRAAQPGRQGAAQGGREGVPRRIPFACTPVCARHSRACACRASLFPQAAGGDRQGHDAFYAQL